MATKDNHTTHTTHEAATDATVTPSEPNDGSTAPEDAGKAAKAKRVMLGGTITEDLFAFVDEMRWNHRLNKAGVVESAVLAWAKERGYTKDQ